MGLFDDRTQLGQLSRRLDRLQRIECSRQLVGGPHQIRAIFTLNFTTKTHLISLSKGWLTTKYGVERDGVLIHFFLQHIAIISFWQMWDSGSQFQQSGVRGHSNQIGTSPIVPLQHIDDLLFTESIKQTDPSLTVAINRTFNPNVILAISIASRRHIGWQVGSVGDRNTLQCAAACIVEFLLTRSTTTTAAIFTRHLDPPSAN